MSIRTEQDFTDLFRTHYDDLLRFVRRRSHPDYADDIVGETFTAAWRRRVDLPDDARPWLFKTARNLMLNSTRGINRQDALAVRVGVVPTTGGPADIEARLDLQKAWRALPAPDQEVLALTIWEDLPHDAAAAVLGCSRAAYGMRLTRAKRRLAELLDVSANATAHPNHF